MGVNFTCKSIFFRAETIWFNELANIMNLCENNVFYLNFFLRFHVWLWLDGAQISSNSSVYRDTVSGISGVSFCFVCKQGDTRSCFSYPATENGFEDADTSIYFSHKVILLLNVKIG